MAPTLSGRRFRGNRAQVRVRCDTETTLIRHNADCVAGLVQLCRFASGARELGDGAERADAPASVSIGKLAGEKVHDLSGCRHADHSPPIRAIACDVASNRKRILRDHPYSAKIIQIDRAELREGLPLRRAEWQHYLDWAVECFRLTSSGVQPETQIHTHMCYSEFNDINAATGAMDADVISIETARSKMELLDAFATYDIRRAMCGPSLSLGLPGLRLRSGTPLRLRRLPGAPSGRRREPVPPAVPAQLRPTRDIPNPKPLFTYVRFSRTGLASHFPATAALRFARGAV
jgi:hypothetical protein